MNHRVVIENNAPTTTHVDGDELQTTNLTLELASGRLAISLL